MDPKFHMADDPIRREELTKTQTEGRRPCGDRGRNLKDRRQALQPKMVATTIRNQKEVKKGSSLAASEGPCPGMPILQKDRTRNICCFPMVAICYCSHRKQT
jgi:hypothetical protein